MSSLLQLFVIFVSLGELIAVLDCIINYLADMVGSVMDNYLLEQKANYFKFNNL